MSIPCFIINKERLNAPKRMIEYLADVPNIQTILVDNNSTYPPLLEYMNSNPPNCIIERMPQNFGECVVWHPDSGLYDKYITDRYIITDSDLDLSGVPKDFLQVMEEGLRRYPDMLKVGLSIEINDLPDNAIGKEAKGWEQMNWVMLDDMYIKAPIDTTFSLLRNRASHDFDKCLRIRRPYTCKHLPWYMNKDNMPDDERYYLSEIGNAHNHYSKRLRDMVGIPAKQ